MRPHRGEIHPGALSLDALRERLSAVERRASAGGGDGVEQAIATGWDAMDAALGGGGLRRGGLHEWVGLAAHDRAGGAGSRRGRWSPPLGVLVHVAARCMGVAAGVGEGGGMTVCWVGRRVWPSVHALSGEHEKSSTGGGTLLACSLLVDATCAADRLWAADLAARCAGALVVVDGSGMDMAASRRLLLAAEAGAAAGAWMVHLARPPWELKQLSAATTRWLVSRRPAVAGSEAKGKVRLGVTLLRSRGPGSLNTQDRTSVIQRDARDRYVPVPAEPAQRSGAASPAA